MSMPWRLTRPTPNTLYAGTYGGGVFKSTDGGANWSLANSGLTNFYVNALAIDPNTPTTLYAGTNGGVFKSADGGANWSAPGSRPDLRLRPGNGSDELQHTLRRDNGGVFKSTNGGANWSAVNTGLTNLNVYALAINPTMLYAGTWYGGAFALQHRARVFCPWCCAPHKGG
jgi:photosystem II stability/assembly factor-like uncharacterized protein